MNEPVILAAMIGLAMALVKLLEKAWDAKTAKADPMLEAIQKEIGEIRAVLTKQAEVSSRQADIAERMVAKVEKLERGQIRLLERSSKSQSGERQALT